MPDHIKRATIPAKDASKTQDLDSMTVADWLRWIAAAFPAILKYNEVGDKAMLDLTPAAEALAAKHQAPAKPEIPTKLSVPYFAQLDSSTGQGGRMCFSSSSAMLAKYLKPNSLSDSANADDEYLKRVQAYGDTTEAPAQVRALGHLGIKAVFHQDLTWADLDRQLAAGKPIPIGILHRGHVSAPTGGGHWIVVIGKEGEAYRCHDPAGDLDLVSGQYTGGSGKSVLYSKKNLGPRWMVGGGPGWGILA